MYGKSDLSTLNLPLTTISPLTTMEYSLVQGPSEGNKFFLAYQAQAAISNHITYCSTSA